MQTLIISYSWLLLQVLTTLNVGVITENSKNHISVSFANQLEQMQYWDYAIFVLLFIKNNSLKKTLIMGILDRNLTLDYNKEIYDIYDFLVNKIKIPGVWIHEVLATKAKLANQPWVEFYHSLYAENYPKGHDIAMKHLVPELLANHHDESVRTVLQHVENSYRYILNWKDQGGLLLEFFWLKDSIEEGEDENEPHKLVRLRNILFRVCQRIKYYPTKNALQTLSISEVSKSCAGFLRILFNEDGDKKSQIHANTQCIEELIMPPDYKTLEYEKYMVEYLNI